jgi:hypothetical protein
MSEKRGGRGYERRGLAQKRAMLVSKLRGARDRKRATGVKVEGRRSHQELRPDTVALAKQLQRERKSYREISRELFSAGHATGNGREFSASAIMKMLQG